MPRAILKILSTAMAPECIPLLQELLRIRPSPTGVWSFEWSINSDYLGRLGMFSSDFTYLLQMRGLPVHLSPRLIQFLMILTFWDHAIGDNNTLNGGGMVARREHNCNTGTLLTVIRSPRTLGSYIGFPASAMIRLILGIISLRLAHIDSNMITVASTTITVRATPEPSGLFTFTAVLMGLGARRKRKSKLVN